MPDKIYPIRGICVSSGQPTPLRREFNGWAADHEGSIQVSLFIRALQKFYDMRYDETESYFQIAGIHGFPADHSWNLAPLPTHGKIKGPKMYCTHGLITFPTWHRVYMLLFEQRIHELMTKVIEGELTFSDDTERQQWTVEANQWRLPYWNWGLPDAGTGIPDLFTRETIVIKSPGTKSSTSGESRANPLFRYLLRVDGEITKMGDLPHPLAVIDSESEDVHGLPFKLPWSRCSGTSRWGVDSGPETEWSSGVNNWEKANDAIKTHQYKYSEPGKQKPEINNHRINDIVCRILTPGFLSTFRAFSTTSGRPKDLDWKKFLSLEFIHNSLHRFIGGGDLVSRVGHMQDVPVAAFDPIFWMHHCNIDLYLATWQTLNPNVWFTDKDSPKATDDLSPFYREIESGKFRLYNSDDVRSCTNLGYQYDVLERKKDEGDGAYIDRIKKYVDSYDSTGRALRRQAVGSHPEVLGSSFTVDEPFDDYIINVFYDRNALGGDPYTIHFFLGKVSDEEIDQRTNILETHPRHVGSVFTFSARMNDENQTRCGNCAQQAEDGVLSTAQIPVTLPLLKLADDPCVDGISHLEPPSVEHFMKDHLDWRAINVIGQRIPLDRLPKTKIFVLKGKARHPDEPEKLSEYFSYEAMVDATADKPLGACRGDYESNTYGYE